jgi:putative spermidine/putrescine transport system substrate-binding protein
MTDFPISRRHVLAGMAGTATLGFSGNAFAEVPPLPSSPVSINLVDVAGNLALTQPAIEAYRAANPKLVSRIIFSKAPAPELPGKIKAQQAAKRVDIDGVLTGIDVLSAGVEQKLWTPLFPDFQSKLPVLKDVLLPEALQMQDQAQNQGICISYCPAGPLLEYMPERVKKVPTTADELLAWAKENPNKFMYARPANSGPGRALLMCMPYILGDSDPKDPVKGWDKTWAYLKELGKYIEYYPSGTTPTFKELGDGTRDMVASHAGWDLNPRALGIVPKEAKITTLKGFHWVMDAHYICMPSGIAPEKVAVMVDLMNYLLTPKAQAYTYDAGYFYPGPSVKNVPLSLAPEESQKIVTEFGRPEYDKLIADNPKEVPLPPAQLVVALRRWDEEVGAQKSK